MSDPYEDALALAHCVLTAVAWTKGIPAEHNDKFDSHCAKVERAAACCGIRLRASWWKDAER
jgi:hypothetical protein